MADSKRVRPRITGAALTNAGPIRQPANKRREKFREATKEAKEKSK